MLYAGMKAALLFGFSVLALYVLLRSLLPPIDEQDREFVKIPKSFDDLKALNGVLQVRSLRAEGGPELTTGDVQVYKDRHYWRVLGCYTTVYLFLQAFSIPGSMYLSSAFPFAPPSLARTNPRTAQFSAEQCTASSWPFPSSALCVLLPSPRAPLVQS